MYIEMREGLLTATEKVWRVGQGSKM